MVPPRPIRRLVLAPLVIVIALGFIVLSPFLALLALVSGLLARSGAGRMRSLRLVGFALVWLVAETVALILLAGLWVVSGFGGRLRTEPYQSRHYGVMRWFLDTMYRGAEKTYGLRVEVDEPDLTGDELAARLARPVIVLSRHAGPGDSFLLVHQLLSVYHRRPRVVMKAALQLDPSVDVVGNRLPNVWIKSRQAGEQIFTSRSRGWPAGSTSGVRWSSSLRAGTGPRAGGAGGSSGWSTWAALIWPNGPGICPTCSPRAPAGRSPPSPPARTPTWSSWRTPGSTTSSRWATCGASSRSIRSSGPGGGGWRMIPYPVRPIMRPRSSGCTPGGNGSTRGSPRTVPRRPRGRRPGRGYPGRASGPWLWARSHGIPVLGWRA